MRDEIKKPPREFNVSGFIIKDFGKIHLGENEMISLVTKSGRECDFTVKEWGFYPTPSLNHRLKNEGFKAALVRYPGDKIFINIVEKDKMDLFYKYLKSHQDQPKVIIWLEELDGPGLDRLEDLLS